MEPKIVQMEALTVVGLEYVGKNEHMEIPALWGAFIPRYDEVPHKQGPCGSVGVCADMQADGTFTYIAGVVVDRVDGLPAGMVAKEVPAAQYAVFTHHGPLFGGERDLAATMNYIYREWLPTSGYTRADTADLEIYDNRFAGNEPHSEIDIYIPIKSV